MPLENCPETTIKNGSCWVFGLLFKKPSSVEFVFGQPANAQVKILLGPSVTNQQQLARLSTGLALFCSNSCPSLLFIILFRLDPGPLLWIWGVGVRGSRAGLNRCTIPRELVELALPPCRCRPPNSATAFLLSPPSASDGLCRWVWGVVFAVGSIKAPQRIQLVFWLYVDYLVFF